LLGEPFEEGILGGRSRVRLPLLLCFSLRGFSPIKKMERPHHLSFLMSEKRDDEGDSSSSSSHHGQKSDDDAELMPPPSSMKSAPTNAEMLSVPGRFDQFPMWGGPQRVTEGVGVPRKKPLAPGHSPMDWARLKTSENLAGVDRIARYTLEELKLHNKKDDVWMSYKGKIYNCTRYIPFHPGGAGQLMRGAGKDATDLISKVHAWVNIEVMLDKCFVGFLVKE
jgi:predicted heme/steroid binding protein